MTEIDNLLDMINDDVRCQIIPVFGEMNSLPDDKLIYPEDVVYFYSRCNGVNLFSKDRTKILFSILPKEKILQANQEIVGETCDDDISASWYLIGKVNNSEYLSIDLSHERNGRCYDSNYEIHGVVGSCPIIAMSFTELLSKLYFSNGDDIYWAYKDYGDAYEYSFL
ncbi:SMI1/KNR4 family protein [Escherichia fergusonii]|uniref:SMI1/KNR4 family protein n=1 Tax=Escherichia fergusonii TaxID=564 RepID=UPI0015E959AA|nr:SMI1/KNR4 family protein [Escherichia fergusonii]QMJ69440.1 SMI1/KNR4 family protein [Escherichia fergusonii]QMJ73902.1 SMI1/KNR4 family protein [Escherichia fergusonii]